MKNSELPLGKLFIICYLICDRVKLNFSFALQICSSIPFRLVPKVANSYGASATL